MSRGILQVLKDELASEEMFPFFALDLTDGSTEYKYTTLDVPITLTGDPSGVYDPRGFIFEGMNYSLSNVMDDCNIRIDNLDDFMTPIFIGGDIQEQPASVYLGVLDNNGDVIGTIQLFKGEVDSYRINEVEVSLVIGSYFTRWSSQAFSQHSPTCTHKVFKGNRCKYSGVQTDCDRSYKRCQTLGNTAYFRGFIFLPSIVDKDIWWGRTQGGEPTPPTGTPFSGLGGYTSEGGNYSGVGYTDNSGRNPGYPDEGYEGDE